MWLCPLLGWYNSTCKSDLFLCVPFFFFNGQDLSGLYSFFKPRVNMIVKFCMITFV